VTGVKRVVTIDGPSGAGKSTVSRRLAAVLGFTYLDSGALYRALAWSLLESGRDIDDPADVEAALGSLDLAVDPRPDEFIVMVDGRPVGIEVRTSEVSQASSKVSTMAQVRRFLLGRQRDCAELADIVAEGRDMGTVVFPEAAVKFFLTARDEVRARRRYLELIEQGRSVNFETVLADTRRRDHRDENREIAPLRPAPDMTVIDASDLNVDQVVRRLVPAVIRRWPEYKKVLSTLDESGI
jgi:cytidylate kinase